MRHKIMCALGAHPVIAIAAATALFAALPASAQTYTAIYNFKGKFEPLSTLLVDGSGNLFGTAQENVKGQIFELKPPAPGQTAWTEATIHQYGEPGAGGIGSWSGVFADSTGALYGTSEYGGTGSCAGPNTVGCGLVYQLTPPVPGKTAYTSKVLYEFTGTGAGQGADGTYPTHAPVITDSAAGIPGAFYGSTQEGGIGSGTVFDLIPPVKKGGKWTQNVLYKFCTQPSCTDGQGPEGHLLADASGVLYGTTEYGGAGQLSSGTAFMLSPPAAPGGAWSETALYSFCSQANCADGEIPFGGLVKDSQGNLYGTTFSGGTGGCANATGCGTVFELTPPSTPGGGWTHTVLYSFTGLTNGGTDGEDPLGDLAMDSQGALYGITIAGGDVACIDVNKGSGCGTVYKLTPPSTPGGAWTESILHSFAGGNDGEFPEGGVAADANGALYGIAGGGTHFYGLAYKITQ